MDFTVADSEDENDDEEDDDEDNEKEKEKDEEEDKEKDGSNDDESVQKPGKVVKRFDTYFESETTAVDFEEEYLESL